MMVIARPLDVFLWTLAAPLAYFLRVEQGILDIIQAILIYTFVGLPIKAFLTYIMGLHWQSWHKVGIRDLTTLLRATGLVTLLLIALSIYGKKRKNFVFKEI